MNASSLNPHVFSVEKYLYEAIVLLSGWTTCHWTFPFGSKPLTLSIIEEPSSSPHSGDTITLGSDSVLTFTNIVDKDDTNNVITRIGAIVNFIDILIDFCLFNFAFEILVKEIKNYSDIG